VTCLHALLLERPLTLNEGKLSPSGRAPDSFVVTFVRSEKVKFGIEAYRPEQKPEIIALSLRAWGPVFEGLRPAVPAYAYEAFYPQGWAVRQAQEVEEVLDQDEASIWVALDEAGVVIGWAGLLFHRAVQLGEIRIIAVDPQHHRQGIASALLNAGEQLMRDEGLKVALVGTGADPGHAPARRTYENAGYRQWPSVQYMKQLRGPPGKR
jgi:GNAT superfamily N-acetyltransferase